VGVTDSARAVTVSAACGDGMGYLVTSCRWSWAIAGVVVIAPTAAAADNNAAPAEQLPPRGDLDAPLIAAPPPDVAPPADAPRSSRTPATPAAAPEPAVGGGASDADELAKALANPIANLVSVPLQSNFDFGAGPGDDGFRYTLNVQPVIPVDLGEDWTLITRTILPVVYQDDEASALSDDDAFGLGDTVFSAFFSPKTGSKVTWGVGPVVYLPTATEDVLGADQWGLGPTAVIVVADGPWTYGGLVNHVWSLGETRDFDSFPVDRPHLNATFLQPFASYSLGGGWSVGANIEATYDWEAEQWTVPAFVNASKVFTVGGQTMSLQAGPRYYLEAPDNGPEWGFRLNLTLIFPK